MIETALSVNGQDCTTGPGNTAEEYEAMAAALLRVAQAIREKDNGTIKCLSRDGRALVSAIVHNRTLSRNDSEMEFPIIEELRCIEEECQDRTVAFRNIAGALIDHFRHVNIESR